MRALFPPILQTSVLKFGLLLATHPSDTSYNVFLANLGHLAIMSSSEFLKQPFSPPPPGVVPSQSNIQSRGYVMITSCSVFLGIMIVFVSVRIYAKLWIIHKVTWDDRIPCLSFSPNSQQANFRHSDMSHRICMSHWGCFVNKFTDRRLSIAPYSDLLCHLCKRFV